MLKLRRSVRSSGFFQKGTGTALCILFFVLLGTSCNEEPKKVVQTEPVVFKKEGELSIFRQRTDSLLVKMDIEIAESEYETQTGLMYRKGMEDHQGMLFIFPDSQFHSFYMKNTEFDLDIIFLDHDKKIATIQKEARALDESSVPSEVPVQYVLEINAGLSDQWQLAVGDKIEFTRE